MEGGGGLHRDRMLDRDGVDLIEGVFYRRA